MSKQELEGKVALVTGAAVGYKDGGPSIGSAIAMKLAAAGAKVVVVDVLEEAGQKTADRINEAGGQAVFVPADVADSAAVQSAVQSARDNFDGLNCLVNCAAHYGGDIFNSVIDTPEEDWLSVFNVNLHGYYRFAKYSVPVILESGGGTIVNISSMAAFAALSNFAVYPVTKAAINALTRVLAVDHAPKIRTNAICPGFVRIANSENDRSPEEIEKWLQKMVRDYPLRRICTVDEIASLALFLSSDESSYVNGECIRADGGRSIADVHDF